MKGKREAEKSQEMTRLREKGRIRKQNERRKEEKNKKRKVHKRGTGRFLFLSPIFSQNSAYFRTSNLYPTYKETGPYKQKKMKCNKSLITPVPIC